jgi:putative membrane protein
MQILYRIVIGILIGAGAILPGISSGVLCVIFGIYDKLVNSILNFFKNIKENATFLFPILFGIAIGVVAFGNLLKQLFTLYPIQTKFAFMGLILGCLPSLFKIANSKKGFRLHYLLYTLLSFTITILLVVLEKNLSTTVFISTRRRIIFNFKRFYNVNWNSYPPE